MKMVRSGSIKQTFFIFLSLIAVQSFGSTAVINETHKLLMKVNANWVGLEHAVKYTFTPTSEQELVQLHLLNVVAYLEEQPINNLNNEQQKNRRLNISILRKYGLAGDYPLNSVTTYRTPIFIDSKNTHCAVGYLLKENGLGIAAQEIAKKQLLSYLEDIQHPELTSWQKNCGLSLFELALIQPTYGPPIPVCAAPSPIEWNTIKVDSRITQLFQSNNENSIYGIAQLDDSGLRQEVKSYSARTHLWSSVGSQINGEIMDLIHCNKKIFISVLLPNEAYPHQLLKLSGNKWEKVAHFNGSVISIQAFQNKLYVLGNFKTVNESIRSNFVVIDKGSIHPVKAKGLTSTYFDHMTSSKSALFLTSNGAIYKFKNDTIKHLASIQYYQYLTDISLDALEDSLFVTSIRFPGYNTYYDIREHSSHLSNMTYGQNYPYNNIYITKSQKINGNMLIAGDFKTSTLIPQINDERVMIQCADSSSTNWYGEGLMYENQQNYFPILEKGIVLDFVHLNDQIYILKKDGTISYASLTLIEKKITELKKRAALEK